MAINIARRKFIATLGGTAFAWPLAVRAEQTAMPVVGFLSSRSPDQSKHLVAAFHIDGRRLCRRPKCCD